MVFSLGFHHSSAPYVPHPPLNSVFLIWSLQWNLVRSTEHKAPCYVVFSTPTAYITICKSKYRNITKGQTATIFIAYVIHIVTSITSYLHHSIYCLYPFRTLTSFLIFSCITFLSILYTQPVFIVPPVPLLIRPSNNENETKTNSNSQHFLEQFSQPARHLQALNSCVIS